MSRVRVEGVPVEPVEGRVEIEAASSGIRGDRLKEILNDSALFP